METLVRKEQSCVPSIQWEINKCLLNKCMNGWSGFIAQESHASQYLQGTVGNNKPLQSDWTERP